MSFDAWLIVFALAALALLVGAIAVSVRLKARRSRRRAPMRRNIEAWKLQLTQLRARLAAGEITQQAYDEQAQRLTAFLLPAASTPAPAAAAPRPFARKGPVAAGALVLVVGLAAGAFYLSQSRTPTAPATSEPAGAEVAAPTQEPQGSAAAAAGNPADKPAHSLTDEQLQRMVEQASTKVAKNPKDAAAWAMLAHSYDMLGKFAESSKAYAKLAPLVPNDAQVLADYADALAVTSGRTLLGEPTALVKKALAIDAKNVKALALAGSAAFERKDYDEAVRYWQRARDASPDAAFKRQIEGSIADAKSAAKGDAAPERETRVSKSAPVGAAARGASAVVSGRVSLADELVAKAAPDATVFIFARPAKGSSRMPVAILRKHVRDLPVDFSLDDTMSMVPDVKLSQVATVVIGARVSKRGDVMPQPGDMQGWSAPVSVGTKGIKLEIGEVIK